MSSKRRLIDILRDNIGNVQLGARIRRRQRGLARYAMLCQRSPEVLFLPHRLNLK